MNSLLMKLINFNIAFDFDNLDVYYIVFWIIFQNNSWYILDGQENRESLNGTWRQFDSCSLNHNDEIRVSEYYLKVIRINLVWRVQYW